MGTAPASLIPEPPPGDAPSDANAPESDLWEVGRSSCLRAAGSTGADGDVSVLEAAGAATSLAEGTRLGETLGMSRNGLMGSAVISAAEGAAESEALLSESLAPDSRTSASGVVVRCDGLRRSSAWVA